MLSLGPWHAPWAVKLTMHFLCGCFYPPCSHTDLEPARLSPEPRGSLHSLVAVPLSGVELPAPGVVTLAVLAVGINFRWARCFTASLGRVDCMR